MQRFLVTAGLLFFSVVSFAQTTIPKHIDVNTGVNKKLISIQTKSVAQAAVDTIAIDSVVNFIVRLKTSPGARTSAARQSLSFTINQEHQDFLSGLNNLNSNIRTSPETQTIEVVHEFRRSINGFTLKANRSLSDAIRKMPHVISVSEDKKVKANDEGSNAALNVPKVWNDLNAKGDGVLIGIIDTGIDYRHPDLGGGIGSNKKVIGGYDFINNDSDPLDDHGHGTHVAGIAAANGLLKGVAPNAKLMAIKVLDSFGSGSDSQVLSGIEYAMDPDGNPGTNDAPDVVNMSLGRLPDPNEPMSEAVNNAVQSGIVFCIAAGNDYSYMKIGTPGIAEEAITVAATDNYDNTAAFSSRGPVTGSFFLKPDVAAPGVDINSTFPNSSYELLSGTSMATPHITGIAALMLGMHPDWTPADVKAAMMSTARLAEQPKYLETGAGVVDAHKAITTDIIMSPGSISYGIVDNTPGTFTKQNVITVTNKGTSAQQMSLAVTGVTSGSINVTLTPSSFQLQPGTSKEVTVKISVARGTLEKNSVGEGHYATVELTSGAKKLKTLLSLFNPTISTIQFPNDIPTSILVMGMTNTFWESYNPTSNSLEVLLPANTYDIIAWFPESIVFVEDIIIGSDPLPIVIDSRAAKNTVTMKAVDDGGLQIPVDSPNLAATTAMFGPKVSSMWFWPQFNFRISDTKKYKIYNRYCYAKPNTDKVFEVTLGAGEVTSTKIVTNNPADFTPAKYTNPSVDEGQYQDLTFYSRTSAFTQWSNKLKVANPSMFMVSDTPGGLTASFYKFAPANGASGFVWETAPRSVDENNNFQLVDFTYTQIKSLGSGPYDFRLGQNLLNFTAYSFPYDDVFILTMFNYLGVYNHSFYEHASGTVNWTMTKDGAPLSSGSFLNHTMEDTGSFAVIEQPITPYGNYKIDLTWDNNYVAGRFGDAKTELTFKGDNAYVPSINTYDLKSDGKITNLIEEGKGGTIDIRVNAPTIKLEMKPVDSDTWNTMSLSVSDDINTATIPASIEAGYYSLRLTGVDYYGNSITHTLEPAFAVGEQSVTIPFTKVALLTPANYDINTGVDPIFTWSSIPDASYLFQISKSATFDNLLTSRQLSEEQFNLSFHLVSDETYYWRVRANINGSALPWSNTFSFTASTLMPATLISPENNAIRIFDDPVTLTWTPSSTGGAIRQEVMVSMDPAVEGWIVYAIVPLQQGQYQAYGLPMGQTFYWKVATTYWGANQPTPTIMPSEIFSFQTGYRVTGLEDEASAVQTFPNPFTEKAYIKFNSETDGRAQLNLLDQLGRSVRSSQHSLITGENTIMIEGEASKSGEMALTQGLYVAVVELDSGVKFRVKILRK